MCECVFISLYVCVCSCVSSCSSKGFGFIFQYRGSPTLIKSRPIRVSSSPWSFRKCHSHIHPETQRRGRTLRVTIKKLDYVCLINSAQWMVGFMNGELQLAGHRMLWLTNRVSLTVKIHEGHLLWSHFSCYISIIKWFIQVNSAGGCFCDPTVNHC